MCALHINSLELNHRHFFMQDCEKKLTVRIQNMMCSYMLVMVHERACNVKYGKRSICATQAFFIGDHFLLDCLLKYDFMRQLYCDVKCEIDCLHVPCHLALSQPVLVFCVLWVTCDIQMHTQWGYVVYYWNHPLMLHTFSNAFQFKTFSVNSRSHKRKPIS